MLKKILKITVIIVFAAFVLGQFVRPDRTNPAIDDTQTLEATAALPTEARAILDRSCADCHTNRTVYPWYSNISPVSWFLQDHIDHGRSHLNLSVWNTYDTRKKLKKLEEICEQVEEGTMPLPSYLWIHWDAGLRPGEADILCNWTRSESSRLQPL
jgi:hypothetical protein